jgi:RNA polymerase sigma-70 factor (ECF subfamily)
MQESDRLMEFFIKSVEKRAFRMARIATGNTEDALDIVQDAMFRFVERYGRRLENEWKPLFYRVLQNKIRDWYRRKAVRNRIRGWLGRGKGQQEEEAADPLEAIADLDCPGPQQTVEAADDLKALEAALSALPLRQQQAFLLRAWNEMSVGETSRIMKCSEGSVKTHYARAVRSLRDKLENRRP